MNTQKSLGVMLLLAVLAASCGAPATTAPPTSAPAANSAPTSAPAAAAPTDVPSAPTAPAPVAATAVATDAPVTTESTSVTLTWYGHSTFVLAARTGLKALLDPAEASTGYKIPKQDSIDLVTVSHEHSDHNAVSLASGSPLILRGLAGNDWAKIDQTVKGVRVQTVGTYHDDTQGSRRGKNAVFIFEVDGLRLAHLGDLGHTLSAEQVKQIGPVDIVLIPVGGFYTIDAEQAVEVVNQLNPKIVIPMHYKTPDLSLSLDSVEDFTNTMGSQATLVQAGHTLALERGKLPASRTIMVMKYK